MRISTAVKKRLRGKLFVVSAPSGGGKTTLCDRLLERVDRLEKSVSITSRPPRAGEKEGKDYYFVSREEFEKKINAGVFLEWEENFGWYYGTPAKAVRSCLKRGTDVILAIDVKGAMQVKESHPDGVYIFISPPSLKELQRRLNKRKSEAPSAIAQRIKTARNELSYIPRYTYLVINDNLRKAVDELRSVIMAERCKIEKP